MSEYEEEDEEVVLPGRRGHARPPWAFDTYSAAFRAVPPRRHGGAQSVTDEDTLGTLADCWCGLPFDHDWPGKASGAKHPKGTQVQQTSTLERRDLRAYHSAIQDFVLHEVKVNGLKWRLQKNAILLYPPDGTAPISVYARNTDTQIRNLGQWHQKHVEDFLHPKVVDEKVVKVLAKTVNDPVEHPVEEKMPETPVVVEVLSPPVGKGRSPVSVQPRDIDHTIPGDWNWYLSSKGEFIEGIATDGEMYLCVLCYQTDHPFLADKPAAIGGHRRMWHSPDSEAFRAHRDERIRTQVQPKGAQANQAAAATRTKTSPRPFTHEDYVKSGQQRSIKNKQMKEARIAIQALCDAIEWWPENPALPKIDGKTLDAEANIARLQDALDRAASERDEAIAERNEARRRLGNIMDALG